MTEDNTSRVEVLVFRNENELLSFREFPEHVVVGTLHATTTHMFGCRVEIRYLCHEFVRQMLIE